jgi:hypothetical protein
MARLGFWALVRSSVLPRKYSPLRKEAERRLKQTVRNREYADSSLTWVGEFADRHIANERESDPALVPRAEARKKKAVDLVTRAHAHYVGFLDQSREDLDFHLEHPERSSPRVLQSHLRMHGLRSALADGGFADAVREAERSVHPDPALRAGETSEGAAEATGTRSSPPPRVPLHNEPRSGRAPRRAVIQPAASRRPGTHGPRRGNVPRV